MPRRRTVPALNSSTLRMRRLRARRAGRPLTGYAAITYQAAMQVRARMFRGQPDPYGPGITRAIMRAMYVLVVELDEPHPVHHLKQLVCAYRLPHNPVVFLNRAVGEAIGRPVELAYKDPWACRQPRAKPVD